MVSAVAFRGFFMSESPHGDTVTCCFCSVPLPVGGQKPALPWSFSATSQCPQSWTLWDVWPGGSLTEHLPQFTHSLPWSPGKRLIWSLGSVRLRVWVLPCGSLLL